MDEIERQQWATQIAAARERADAGTKALFTMRNKLDEAAREWARTANGFPVAQSLRILADDCVRAWNAALAAHEADQASEARSAIEEGEKSPSPLPSRWPWGDHETDLLRHLAEAGRQWWGTFDPDDHGTAPTNADVVAWLQKRGVAQRNAEVMATILRADGLPTGPRK
jgi:hypothetical protein